MTDNQKEIKRLSFLLTKLRKENAELKALIEESKEEDILRLLYLKYCK